MESGAASHYVQPLQNPTGRIMSAGPSQSHCRRSLRKHELLLVEDDLYAAYAQELGHPTLAALGPERVFHVSGLSKSLSPRPGT